MKTVNRIVNLLLTITFVGPAFIWATREGSPIDNWREKARDVSRVDASWDALLKTGS